MGAYTEVEGPQLNGHLKLALSRMENIKVTLTSSAILTITITHDITVVVQSGRKGQF